MLQYLLVLIAFLLMVIIGSLFASRLVNKYIANYGDEVIGASAETIKTYLQGHEITLNDIAFVVEELWAQNKGAGSIEEELVRWSDWVSTNDQRFNDFLFLYGVIDGIFVDSSDWVYPDNYDPETRIWYTGAYGKNGGIFYSDPYIDAHTGEYVMTISRLVYDHNREPFGVIALDVLLSNITGYISSMKLMDSGYGVLMDSKRRIIIHPAEGVFGVPLESLTGGSGYDEIASLLKAGEDVSAYNYTSIMGGKSVGFFKKLFNGWYIELSLSSKVYYSEVSSMQVVLSVTGSFLALLFCWILTFMHIARTRSEAASKVKSSFLANMSHEIRTPMNAIIGMTELLQHEQLSERQQDYVDDINASARSLLSIINDILDLSKIESGKLILNPVNYDFNALIDNISSIFKFVAQKKDIEFRYESVGDIPKTLYGDDIRLRQILTNLCGNAVKYTENGYVRLKVTASDSMLIFEIKDTGIGIPREEIPKLFNAFEQANTEKGRNIVGTGLGLAISKAFVEMMDGNIMLDSEYGQGTVITVMIPIVLGSEIGITHMSKEKTELNIYAPSASILIVDDNEYNLKVAYGLFKLFGIEAKTVFSGIEAIKAVKENDFDIVFMDHMMPEMDGVEATCEIRKLGGKYKTLPIVALTANAIQGVKDMFLANGFNGYISKPIDMQELSDIFLEWLPPEKLLQKAVAEGSAEASEVIQSSLWDAIEDTGEINVEVGLSRASDIESMYCDNLRMFRDRLLPEYNRLSGYLEGKDICNFSISVHAMKSILATIGAMKLSEIALKLETASKNKDLAYCEEQFPGFAGRLLSMHKALSEIFKEEISASVKEHGDNAYLMEHIQKALMAADDYDNDAGIEAIEQLLIYDFGSKGNTLLEEALSAFREYDFDKARGALEKIASG